MTQEQQRIAIAEACGVQTIYFRFWHLSHGGYKWWDGHETKGRAENLFHSFGDPEHPIEEYIETRWLPNYPACLNAMAEALHTVIAPDVDLRIRYIGEMKKVLYRDLHAGDIPHAWPHFASSKQQAECFLKTLGLWTGNNEPNVK